MISSRNYSIDFTINPAKSHAGMTRNFDEKFSNPDRFGNTPFHANTRFILPGLSGAPRSDCIADCRAEHASEHRPDVIGANTGSRNKKACAVRSRRHGRQNSEEYRGAASSKGQSIN
ncbi:hypothetical protein [Burkholderia stabilis]|uniref:hypothetical protein n=1 Tax=Burkholderia stabilis TaxID=95485 RepID=UPI00158AC35A|nr:hypothetical protein [Burkholderia stabilis]